jgi:hypothetical protein
VVGCKKPPFQLAVAASQPAATQPDPAATVANLPPFDAVADSYRQLKRRQETNRRLRLFLPMLNLNIYFRKTEEKYIKILIIADCARSSTRPRSPPPPPSHAFVCGPLFEFFSF